MFGVYESIVPILKYENYSTKEAVGNELKKNPLTKTAMNIGSGILEGGNVIDTIKKRLSFFLSIPRHFYT